MRIYSLDDTGATIEANQSHLEQAKQSLAQLQAQLTIAETNMAQQIAGTRARLRILQRQAPDQWWAIQDLNMAKI